MEKLLVLLGELIDELPENFDDETPFADLDGWDSLKYMRLVLGVESHFGCELEAEEIQSLTSVASIRRVFEARGVSL